ncbi:hypothetical protein, partial [Thioalkalivibrio sp. HK1]|uniref:hypothetical protein n=1 Tax=Thioalkalivibrio sp. HK1 TaxID=1469245 RepID=UPI00056E6322
SAQEITVTGSHDIDIVDESALITLSVDQDIGIVADDVNKSIAVTDDDSPGTLLMLPSPLQVVEGGQQTFIVRLGTVPTVPNVTVDLTNSNASVTLDPTTLFFTDSDWNASQTVTVSVAQDDNAENGTDTIVGTFNNGAGNYASAANPQGAAIAVTTLDRPGDIVVSKTMVDL